MAKKIGIVLALDGEQKFAAGMKNAQSSVKLAQQELRNLDKECKGSANTLEALTERSKALAKVEEEYRKVLEKAKAGRENAVKNYQEAVKALENYRQKQEELEKTVRSGGKSADQAAKELKEYRKAIESQEVEAIKAEAAITAWDTKVAKASSDVNRASREVRLNSKYLAEAKDSADGCATSIDGFGKAIQNAGERAAGSSDQFASASGAIAEMKKGFLSGVGIKMADALANVGSAAVDAAKKLVEAGVAAAGYADEVLTAADITGMSTDRIQEITYAAGLMDTELSTIESSMRKNIASMRSAAKGSAEYAKAYANLGVAVENTDGTLRDSEDVYWDCIDALGKIEDRTERDAAAMQIFGKSAQELNPLISKGSKGFAELAKEAHDVGYVLGSDTLGKLGTVQDSFDRLDAAGEAFGNRIGTFVAPVLGGLADLATDALNGLTAFLRGGRTETEEYLSSITSSVEEAKKAVEDAGNWETGIAKELGELAYYKDALYDVVEAGKADEIQKARVSQIVDELGDKVPELTEAWDEQNGVLRLSKEQVDALISSQEEYIRQTAIAKAKEEAWTAVADATIKAKEAEVIFRQKLVEAEKILGRNVGSLDELNEELDYMAINPMMAGTDEHTRLQTVAREAEAAKKSFDELSPAVDELKEKANLLNTVAEEMGTDAYFAGKKTEEGMRAAEAATKEAMEDAAQSVHQFRDAAQDMADVVYDAFDEAHGAAENAFSVDAFEAWKKNAKNGMAKMGEALAKQAANLQEYSQNFAVVSEDLRERSPEFLAYLQNLGKDGAQLVAELAESFRKGDTKAVDDLIKRYKESLKAQDEIADISAKNTIALKKGLGELGSTAREWAAFDETIRKIKASGIPEALSEELAKTVRLAKEEGIKIPEGLAQEIESSDDPASAAVTCIGKLINAIDGQKTALYNVSHDTGHQVGAGFVLGLQEKYGDVGIAATGMVNVALEKARARARIESPSKLFRDEVGKFIPSGVAAGIRDGNTLTEQAAEESMNKTLAVMKKWLTRNKAGVGEIAYTWQAVATAALKNSFGISRTKTEGSGDDQKTVRKSGSEYAQEVYKVASAYLANLKQLYDVSTQQEIDYWRSVRARLESGTQAWISASGKVRALQKQAKQEAKKQRQEEKSAEKQHYADRLSFMESYASHREAMGKLTAKQERNYWQKYISEFKKGSEEYKRISEKLVALEARIISERLEKYEAYISRQSALHRLSITRERDYWQKRIAEFKKGSGEYRSIQERIASLNTGFGTSQVAASVLSSFQTYYSMSEKAEMQYWNIIRKSYKAGTEDRLAADRAYLDAKERLRDRELEIENDYNAKIEEATARYKDAVAARRDAIYGAFGLFDAFESRSATGDELLFNIQSQAAGYDEWMKSLDELKGRGVFSESLIKELTEKGPADTAAIKALLTLTDDQMKAYQDAYDRKAELSDKQAKKENAGLRKEVKAEIKDLKAEMKSAIADVDKPITDELKAVATKIETIAEDQTAAIVAAFTGEGSSLTKSVGSAVSASTRKAAGITSEQTNGLTEKQSAAKKEAMEAIHGAKKRKPLTEDERRQHAAIYSYLADKYGVAGSSGLYAKLAAIFGLPDYSGTGAERMEILALLKAHGLKSGALRVGSGAAWMDEELDEVGPEIIVRKSDKAILTRLEAADSVIPANLAKNLFAWGAISPSSLKTASMASLNEKLAQAYASQAQAARDNGSSLLKIIGILGEYLPHLADGRDIYLDSDRLVGGLAGGMSRELAKKARRNVR